jgi:hypothetical protein
MIHNLAFVKSSRFLKETITWALRQSFSSHSQESPEMLYRRRLTKEAAELLRSAGHGQDALSSPSWRKAIAMLKEADPDSLAPLEHQLRSPELKPTRALGENITDSDRQRLVNELASNRSRQLASLQSTKSLHASQEGKSLIYYPAENVSDGASKYASKGFYDPFDAPPWDLWISYDSGAGCPLIWLRSRRMAWTRTLLIALSGPTRSPIIDIRRAFPASRVFGKLSCSHQTDPLSVLPNKNGTRIPYDGAQGQ